MKDYCLLIMFIVFSTSVNAQNENLATLHKEGIQLDVIDKKWLSDNTSFAIDMIELVQMDTSSMNKAIVQMSLKLLSHNLMGLTEEQYNENKVLLNEIIYGALTHHGLKEEKLLSVKSWYNMIQE